MIISGFKAARFTEAVEKANEVFHTIENPFIAYRSEQDWLPGHCLRWIVRYIKKSILFKVNSQTISSVKFKSNSPFAKNILKLTPKDYFDTKKIIFEPWYEVNFAEDNFAINLSSKFCDSDKFKNIFCEILDFSYPNSWKYSSQKYRYLYISWCTLKFEGDTRSRVKLLGRVLKKSWKLRRRVLKKSRKSSSRFKSNLVKI